MGGGSYSGPAGFVIKRKTGKKRFGLFPIFEEEIVSASTYISLSEEQKKYSRVATRKELQKAGIFPYN